MLKTIANKIESLEYHTGFFHEKTDEIISTISTGLLIATWVLFFLYKKCNSCFKKFSIINYAFNSNSGHDDVMKNQRRI